MMTSLRCFQLASHIGFPGGEANSEQSLTLASHAWRSHWFPMCGARIDLSRVGLAAQAIL